MPQSCRDVNNSSFRYSASSSIAPRMMCAVVERSLPVCDRVGGVWEDGVARPPSGVFLPIM